jgi:hypothetical protein
MCMYCIVLGVFASGIESSGAVFANLICNWQLTR